MTASQGGDLATSRPLDASPGPVELFTFPNRLDTPALVVDVNRLTQNITRMADAAARHGVALRPHAKTHKSIDVAQRQLAAGAAGLTVATIGEAEVFADAGIEDLFVAYPVWAVGEKAARLRRLAERVQLRIGADSVEGARLLGDCLAGTGASVLVELDSGNHRSGTTDTAVTVRVAAAAQAAGLPVVGAFTHAGHSYAGRAAVLAASADEVDTLAAAGEALRAAGHHITVLSAGSTPTAVDSARGGVTEIRPGTFVYYDRLQMQLGACSLDDLALLVATTVVSHSGGRFVLDAGAKVLSKDLPPVLHGYGWLPAYPAATITRLYDHHAIVEPGDGPRPTLGEVVAVVPNHVCPVVDLADDVTVVLDGRAVELWPVHARGRSR